MSRIEKEQKLRWGEVCEQWGKGLRLGKDCIMMGDVNINYLRWDKAEYRQRKLMVEDSIIPLGTVQCVSSPTRSWTGTERTLLDHIYSNAVGRQSNTIIEKRMASDHKLVWIDYLGMVKEDGAKVVKKCSQKKFSMDDYKKELMKEDWN